MSNATDFKYNRTPSFFDIEETRERLETDPRVARYPVALANIADELAEEHEILSKDPKDLFSEEPLTDEDIHNYHFNSSWAGIFSKKAMERLHNAYVSGLFLQKILELQTFFHLIGAIKRVMFVLWVMMHFIKFILALKLRVRHNFMR